MFLPLPLADVTVDSVVVVAGAITALITAVATLVVSFSTRRKTADVHVLVNARLTETLSRVAQLADALQSAGVQIPRDPAGPNGQPE